MKIKICLMILFNVITWAFIYQAKAATPEEFSNYFGSQTPKILDLYRKGSKQVPYKIYDACLTSSCAELSKMYSFLPAQENESRQLYTRLLMKPKPTKKTLNKIIDTLIAEEEAARIWNLRFKNLRSQSYTLRKCGFPNVINPNQTIQKAQKDHDETLLNCLEAEQGKLKVAHEKYKKDQEDKKAVKASLKSYDCSTVSDPYILLVCSYFNK